jgi:hypothetical protein
MFAIDCIKLRHWRGVGGYQPVWCPRVTGKPEPRYKYMSLVAKRAHKLSKSMSLRFDQSLQLSAANTYLSHFFRQ